MDYPDPVLGWYLTVGETHDFADKVRSINFGSARRRAPKVTTDHHDHHEVDVTEHWNERVDVTVRPDPVVTKVSISGED